MYCWSVLVPTYFCSKLVPSLHFHYEYSNFMAEECESQQAYALMDADRRCSMPGPAMSISMSSPGLVPLVPEAYTCGEHHHQRAGVLAALGGAAGGRVRAGVLVALGGAAGGRVGEQDVTFSHNISCMGTRYVFCLFHSKILCQIHQF